MEYQDEYLEQIKRQKDEWQHWQDVNHEFQNLGIDMNDSKYNRLVSSIQLWGEYLVLLRKLHTEEQQVNIRKMYEDNYNKAKEAA